MIKLLDFTATYQNLIGLGMNVGIDFHGDGDFATVIVLITPGPALSNQALQRVDDFLDCVILWHPLDKAVSGIVGLAVHNSDSNSLVCQSIISIRSNSLVPPPRPPAYALPAHAGRAPPLTQSNTSQAWQVHSAR